MNSGPRIVLLLIDPDGERAASVEAHLRHLGVAVHMTRCDHPTALPSDAPRFDLCVQALDGLHSLAGAGLPVFREFGQDCPVLALGQPAFDCSLGAILAHGFADWVGTDDPLHLRESARRELATNRAQRQTAALREALLDSERRVEQIMHNTLDAHAVVMDGVHANANNPYLRLLGLDPEHATATPFLDCIDTPQQDAIKALLRQFARGDVTAHQQSVSFTLGNGNTRSVDTHFSAWIGDGERGVLVSPRPAHARATQAPAPTASRPVSAAEIDANSPNTQPLPTPPPRERAAEETAPPTIAPATPPTPSVQSAGGLAAEVHVAAVAPETTDSLASGLSSEPVTPAPNPTVSAMRKRLRQSIRQNLLTISLTPLVALDAEATHFLARVEPGKLLDNVADDAALRRVANRVGLASALDRWLLFVASRHAVKGLDQHTSHAPDADSPATLHINLCEGALTDDSLPGWLQQLAGQYPQLRHTLWLPLSVARRSPEATRRLRDHLSDIGMRLCLSSAFQQAGDLPDLRALAPHDVCLHDGVLDAWEDGTFSSENVERLTALLRSQGIGTFCLYASDKLDPNTASRLGFCLISPVSTTESVESGA